MSTMGSLSLNNSVSSLIDENLFGEEEEDGILSRLSPYATLRASDLSTLARQSQEFLHRKGLVAAFAKRFSPEATTFCDQKRKSSLCHVSEEQDVVLRAQDIGDLPIEYTVRRIRPHEMPVIGVYIDTRIVPGFRYRVRHLGSERYVFGGRALTLLSIGLGYGKRLTFQGDSHNFNNNYFWSDSDPNGFGFSLEVVRPGDKFSVFCTNGTGLVGEVKVETVSGVQEEISSEVVKGDIIKQVHVTFECSVTYHQRHHGKVSYKLLDLEKLSGVAYVIKKKGSRVAELDCIYNVTLSRIHDVCTLQFEP